MEKNYAVEILEERLAELHKQIADVRVALSKLNHVDEPKAIIKIDNIKTLKPVKPVKNPAAFHVTKVLKEWLDSQPSPLSLDAFRTKFPTYKEATIKTQFYNYKRITGRS